MKVGFRRRKLPMPPEQLPGRPLEASCELDETQRFIRRALLVQQLGRGGMTPQAGPGAPYEVAGPLGTLKGVKSGS